ncbi:MAG TPA: adenylate/guanylate cyclase domain-containing protein [Moraxellaceae bacterium]|nr:adenylate/guanylate cyclase domain-containing protein [Moraxellaceae bacterium]
MKEFIRSSLRSLPVWVGLALVATVLALHVLSLDEGSRLGRRLAQPLVRLDELIYDWRFQWLTPARPESPVPVVVVDIDEQSLKQEGRWPWSRARVARLVTALEQQGVRLVGFDVVFSEPESNPADAVLDGGRLSEAARAELAAQRDAWDNDARLAEVVPARVVLGYFLHADGVRSGQLPTPLLDLPPAEAEGWRILSLPDYTGNLPVLMARARSAGFVSTLPDRDGVIRRSPLVLMNDNKVYTALSLELARLYLDAPFIEVRPVRCRGGMTCVESVRIGNRVLPTDEHGMALVPYRGGRGSFTYVSAASVLRGQVPAGVFKGAIALVGTSALGLADLRLTPLQTQYPGVEVHANLLEAMLQSGPGQDYFYFRPDWEPGATFFLLILSGLLLALALPRLEPGSMLVGVVAWFAVLLLGNFALWKFARFDLPLAALLLMGFLIASFNIFAGFLRATRQRREIKAMFGQYVPPAHVEQMLASPDAVSLEGESREMTVLFSDVRNFTTLSEGLSAQELKQLLNRYFTPITQIIFDHQGTIDKYVGDMVMAFWNAPLADADHARHAIAAALAMQQKVESLKAEFAASGLPEINIGVGINTGLMNVGDMGSEFRRAYTVLGDAVNLASRLEGITKFYGVKVLVGEATMAQAPDYLYRCVDRLIVKGKHEPITVYEPVCLLAEASESRRARVEKYNDAVACYFARQWDEAEAALRELAAQDPGRRLYRVFLERIDELRRHPDRSAHWTGVYEHTAK